MTPPPLWHFSENASDLAAPPFPDGSLWDHYTVYKGKSLFQGLLFLQDEKRLSLFRVHIFNHYLRRVLLLVLGSEWWLWSILRCLELFNCLNASLTFSILIDDLHLRNFSPPMRKFRKVDSNIAFSFIDIVDCSDAVVVDTITPPIVGPRNRGSHSNPIASLNACRVVLFAWLK